MSRRLLSPLPEPLVRCLGCAWCFEKRMATCSAAGLGSVDCDDGHGCFTSSSFFHKYDNATSTRTHKQSRHIQRRRILHEYTHRTQQTLTLTHALICCATEIRVSCWSRGGGSSGGCVRLDRPFGSHGHAQRVRSVADGNEFVYSMDICIYVPSIRENAIRNTGALCAQPNIHTTQIIRTVYVRVECCIASSCRRCAVMVRSMMMMMMYTKHEPGQTIHSILYMRVACASYISSIARISHHASLEIYTHHA